jgi:hypothetical protein
MVLLPLNALFPLSRTAIPWKEAGIFTAAAVPL